MAHLSTLINQLGMAEYKCSGKFVRGQRGAFVPNGNTALSLRTIPIGPTLVHSSSPLIKDANPTLFAQSCWMRKGFDLPRTKPSWNTTKYAATRRPRTKKSKENSHPYASRESFIKFVKTKNPEFYLPHHIRLTLLTLNVSQHEHKTRK
jgi:hypothetical protein